MSLEKLQKSASSPKLRVSSRYRNLLMAAMAATAVNMTACSDGPGNGDGGTGGTSETGGTGGTETGGTGGTGGVDNCADLKFDGLASKRFEPGEVGSFAVNLDDKHPDSAYNTARFEMVSGDVLTRPALIGLIRSTKDNYDSGYTSTGDVDGLRPVAIDPDQPYIEGENGGCTLNYLDDDAVSPSAMTDPSKLPMMETPTGVYSTVFCIENGQEVKADYVITAERTRFALVNLTTANNEIEIFMANSKPDVSANAFRDMDGHIVVDLGGTTDEEDGSSTVLNQLGLNASGLTFVPVDGMPGQFRTVNPSMATSLNLDVAGLNEGLVDDTSSKQVSVTETDPCIDVSCNGNGTCVNGACMCDAGFANDDMDAKDDCDACDTQSGLYENDYPTCSPDVTPPNAPVITTNSGVNFGILQQNFTLDGTTDSDTDEMWVRAVQTSNPGAGTVLFDWTAINGYTSESVNWSYNGSISQVFKAYEYCVRAEDKANNQSNTDCVVVDRLQ